MTQTLDMPLAPTTAAPVGSPGRAASRTIWGLTPSQLHDRFWAARGVQVVRKGSTDPIDEHAELYMLVGTHTLMMFRLNQLLDTLNWLRPRVLFIRLRNTAEHGYREHLVADDEDRFVRFERVYGGADSRVTRMAMTPDADLARLWRDSEEESAAAWRTLRKRVDRNQRITVSVDGAVFNGRFDREVMHFVRQLVQVWRRPAATISRAVAAKTGEGVWADRDDIVDATVRFIGPVWIGAGRNLSRVDSVVGPTVLWDDPAAIPETDTIDWSLIEPFATHEDHESAPAWERRIKPRRLTRVQSGLKRLFDIGFAAVALFLVLPLFPVMMLAIWLEDGSPFFFVHRRETRGGREFPCLKFRTMRKDAEHMKKELAAANQADGPQFFIEDDPRHTRVGRVMRKLNIDELPQFLNVLVGHMSIVGPRPSPHSENQFCPPWREARLSVRPGITGLWQVLRSRKKGLDFQEWIRYDIEYVENFNWRMDLWIIWRTIRHMVKL